METFQVHTHTLKDIVDLTPKLNQIIKGKNFHHGLCHVFLPHTTAALTTGEIGEGTEKDLLEVAEKISLRSPMIPPMRGLIWAPP